MATGDKVYIADKPTLDATKAAVETKASQASVDVVDMVVDTISANIGTTTNTGGSSTTGTVMAKLNAILMWFTGTWTAARAAFLDVAVSTRATQASVNLLETEVSAQAKYSSLAGALDVTVGSRQSEANALARYTAVQTEIASVKTSVINGKTSLATAINNKVAAGLTYLTSFADMAWHINNIKIYSDYEMGMQMISNAIANNVPAAVQTIQGKDGAYYTIAGSITIPTLVGQYLITVHSTASAGDYMTITNATIIYSANKAGGYGYLNYRLYKATSTSCGAVISQTYGDVRLVTKVPTII